MPTIITRGAASALAFGWARITAFLDPYFKYVTMLLPGNGTNGAQNNTFLDSSANAFSITRNGNTTQGAFSPYGSNWSYSSTANGNLLNIAQNTAFAFGTGDFTIEAWVWRSDATAQRAIIDTRGASSGTVGILFYQTTQGYLTVFDGTGTVVGGSAATGFSSNLWTHVAVTRSGTTTTLWIDGVSKATNASDTRNYANGAGGTNIGRQFGSTTNDWIGFISNLRVVKGTALYTSNFTPSTSPLTAVSGTVLLACQSNRFVDNSSNNFTLTLTGSPSILSFSPFSPSTPYNATTNGGSGYFDGTGDELNAGSNAAFAFGTGAYTVELWVYPTVASTSYSAGQGPIFIFNDTTNGFGFWDVSNSGLRIDVRAGSPVLTSTSHLVTNAWNHVVAVRSGTGTNQTSIFLNGTRVANGTDATNWTITGPLKLGGISATGYYINGYATDARVVKGTAVYDPTLSTITVPTAPLTNVTNTQLLCNFTNAGIIDNAMMGDLETVGNAQISTAQSKFGLSSIYFDGNGDYLFAPDSPNYDFGAGDFTIEFWIYRAASGNFMPIEKTISGQFGSWYMEFTSATNVLAWNCSSTGASNNMFNAVSMGTLPSLNTWYHVALVRNGSNFTGYINGVGTSLGTSTATIFKSTYGITVGAHNGSASFYLNGYIDDLRITKGYARYTANFTPPSAPFPTQ